MNSNATIRRAARDYEPTITFLRIEAPAVRVIGYAAQARQAADGRWCARWLAASSGGVASQGPSGAFPVAA